MKHHRHIKLCIKLCLFVYYRYASFGRRNDLWTKYGKDLLNEKFCPNGAIFKVDGYTPEQLLQDTNGGMEVLVYEQVMYSKLLSANPNYGDNFDPSVLKASNCYLRVEPLNDDFNVFPRDTSNTESKNIHLYIQISFWKIRIGWNDIDNGPVWTNNDGNLTLTRINDASSISRIKNQFKNNKVAGILVSQSFLDWNINALQQDWERYQVAVLTSARQIKQDTQLSNDDDSGDSGNSGQENETAGAGFSQTQKNNTKTAQSGINRAATQVHSTKSSKHKRESSKQKNKDKAAARRKAKTKSKHKSEKHHKKKKETRQHSSTSKKNIQSNKTPTKAKKKHHSKSKEKISNTQTPSRGRRPTHQTARQSKDTSGVKTRAQLKRLHNENRSSSAGASATSDKPPKKKRRKNKKKTEKANTKITKKAPPRPKTCINIASSDDNAPTESPDETERSKSVSELPKKPLTENQMQVENNVQYSEHNESDDSQSDKSKSDQAEADIDMVGGTTSTTSASRSRTRSTLTSNVSASSEVSQDESVAESDKNNLNNASQESNDELQIESSSSSDAEYVPGDDENKLSKSESLAVNQVSLSGERESLGLGSEANTQEHNEQSGLNTGKLEIELENRENDNNMEQVNLRHDDTLITHIQTPKKQVKTRNDTSKDKEIQYREYKLPFKYSIDDYDASKPDEVCISFFALIHLCIYILCILHLLLCFFFFHSGMDH